MSLSSYCLSNSNGFTGNFIYERFDLCFAPARIIIIRNSRKRSHRNERTEGYNNRRKIEFQGVTGYAPTAIGFAKRRKINLCSFKISALYLTYSSFTIAYYDIDKEAITNKILSVRWFFMWLFIFFFATARKSLQIGERTIFADFSVCYFWVTVSNGNTYKPRNLFRRISPSEVPTVGISFQCVDE